MPDTHAPPALDSRQRLAASIHRVLRHEIPAPAPEDELRTSIDAALLEEAKRNELTLEYLRLGAIGSLALLYAIDCALAPPERPVGAGAGALLLLRLLGVAWLVATVASVVALRRGWYRPWPRRATPVGDALMIVIAAVLFDAVPSPTRPSVAAPAVAAAMGTLLGASGALRLTRSAVQLSTALALGGVLAAALLLRVPAVGAAALLMLVLVAGAFGIVVVRQVRRAVTDQVGRATMSRLYGEAQQVIDARAEVLRVVSHDLRNPLSTIAMGAQLLLELVPADRQVERKQLTIMRRATEQMKRLVKDLLDVSIIEAGRLSVEPVRLDLRALVAEVVEALAPLAGEKSIHLDVSLPGELPAVRADPARILQVFSNLVGNAIKFTPERGRITLAATVVDDSVRCDVVDTGPGIPAEQLSQIFGRFWQARRGDRRGIGLGLSIARGIVEAHGQRLWVTSSVGEGSIFSFTLPRD